jgi:thiamine biosynthesis lipoprotein
VSAGPLEFRRARPLLGTLVEISARGDDAARMAEAVEAAFSTVATVHRLMSFQDRASDVTRLNRCAARTPVRVHLWTYAVLEEAQRVAEASRGLFDVSVAAVLVRRGLQQAARGTPVPHRSASFRDIRLLPGFRVRFSRPLLLDLGGIAKGFAVDRAIDCLRRAGMPSGVVNAGGDLRCFGPLAQRVHVRDPGCPERLLPLAELCDGAVATSAAYASRSMRGGRAVCGLVHPGRPGFVPAASASVAARRCITADAWTKVILLGGPRFIGRARRAGAFVRVFGPVPDAGRPDACA